MIDGKWPVASFYKGAPIFAGQPAKRVRLVKAEIDRVNRTGDLIRLSTIALDCSWSPEARIAAGAKCLAGLQRATELRQPRPDINAQAVKAHTGALASRGWANPYDYCSLFDANHQNAVPREVPLDGRSVPDDAED
jgi:hypothetical protein